MNAIELRGLRRDFGDRAALRDIDLRLEVGESLACWARTEPVRRPCCASSPRCCGLAAARRGCSARGSRRRPGRCGDGSASSATSRCSTATSAGARTCVFTLACMGSTVATAETRIEELLAAVEMERRADDRVDRALRRDAAAAGDLPLRPPRARAAAARRARLQPRRSRARAGSRADRARRRTAPGSSSPTTPSARCPKPTRCCDWQSTAAPS